MQKSESINELALALSQAQAEMPTVVFDAVNPHFKSKYATLAAIVECSRPVLGKHGLAVAQVFSGDKLHTLLTHKSGQWLSGELTLHLSKQDMQGLGSAITYARRYSLAAILGIVSDEDDDANAATPAPAQAKQKPAGPKAAPRTVTAREPDVAGDAGDWRSWTVPFGTTTKGKSLEQLLERPDTLRSIAAYLESKLDPESKFYQQNMLHLGYVRAAIRNIEG